MTKVWLFAEHPHGYSNVEMEPVRDTIATQQETP